MESSMEPPSRKARNLSKVALRSLLPSVAALIVYALITVFLHRSLVADFPIIIGFAVGTGIFSFVSQSLQDESPARHDFLRALARSFSWFPGLVGLCSVPFWYWYADRLTGIQGAFFEVSAQVIPVLLLAIMIDVRQSKRLRSSDLVGTTLGLLYCEIVALVGAAEGGGDAFPYSVVSGALTLGFCAVIMAVIAEFPHSTIDGSNDTKRSDESRE
jgi:uncharacterized membrane protein YdcZ (DUF606 family)